MIGMKHVVASAIIAVATVLTAPAFADGTVMFNYQGRVKVQGVEHNGDGQFKFAIISPNGQSTLWSNDSTSVDGSEPTSGLTLPVTDGVFNVVMGANGLMEPINSTVFQTKEPLKLRTWFSDGINGFEQLHPDHNLINVNLITSETGGDDFTIYVDGQNGKDSNSGLKPTQAKKTIQAAVNIVPSRVLANIIIEIADGTYPETVRVFGINTMPGKKLTLRGDENWNHSISTEPSVIITGADGATTGIRENALELVQCSTVALEGLAAKDAGWGGINMRSGEYSLKKCLAKGNGGNGLNAGVQSYVTFEECASTLNAVHGYGVNKSSVASLNKCIGSGNGHSGLSVMENSFGTLHNQCVFSSNGAFGIMTIIFSAVGGTTTYSGTIHNNGLHGIQAAWNSYFSYFHNTSYSGNKLGNQQTFSGGTTSY